MSTFILIVIGIIGFFIIARMIDNKEDKQKHEEFNHSVSNLKSKYQILIDGLVPPELDVKLVKQTPSQLVYKLQTGGGTTSFSVREMGDRLNVIWDFNHIAMGSHSKAWDFYSGGDQNKMLEKVYSDMEEINKKMI